MKTEIVIRPVTRNEHYVVFTFPKVEGFELPYEMVEQLCDVDGFFDAVVIYPAELRKRAERHGLIRTSSRGGSYATPRLKAIAKKLGIS